MDDNQIPEDIDLFEELSQQQEGDPQQEIAEPNKRSIGHEHNLPPPEGDDGEKIEGSVAMENNNIGQSGSGERPPSINPNGASGDGGTTYEGDEEMKQESGLTEEAIQPTASSDFIVVSGDECRCASEGYPMTCASVACVNKFASPQQPESAEVVPEEEPNSYGVGTRSQQHQPDETDASDLLPENNSLIIVGASRDDSEGDVLSPGDGTAGSVVSPSLRSTSETKEAKRQRMAELARQRYQNLSSEEKKAVNSRRMLLRKRKRQREREMEELERILRRSNDIEEDIYFVSEIQERRRRENARTRYQNMTTDERKAYNSRRRLRQLTGDLGKDDEVRRHIAAQNARKAELARQRYHRMNPNERRSYNRRRTDSLRRRRTEEEALLSTPAGQISAEALQRAQQIMERNAARAEKARERYRRKMSQLRTGPPHSSSSSSQQAQIHQAHYVQQHPSSSQQQHQIQPRHSAVPIAHHQQQQPHQVHVLPQHQHQQQVYHIPAQHPHQPHQQIIIQPVGGTHPQQGHQATATQLVTQMPTSAMPKRFRKGRKGAAAAAAAAKAEEVERGGELESEGDVLGAIERDLLRRTQQAKMVLEQQKASTSGVKQDASMTSPQQTHVVQLVQHPHHHQQPATSHLVSAGGGGQGHYGHGDGMGGDGKTGTRYVSYVPLPAGATQQGFLLPDGQFVAIQPQDGHTYTVEHPYDNHPTAYQHQPTSTAGTTIVRTHRGGAQASHAIVGQRVELVQQDPGTSSYHTSTAGGLHMPQHPTGTIHVVNYQQPGQSGHGHLANHHPPHRHHVGGNRLGAMASMESSAGVSGVMDEKTQVQKAKRAERARRRYHEMSAESRHQFNARRAQALKMARLRDEELCRLGDEIDINQSDIDDELRNAIHQARLRRAKRAESARQKYQRMTPEQRKAHNALRDAQRRMRKREMEEKGIPAST